VFIPNRIGVPTGVRQKILDPIGAMVARTLGQLPAVRALKESQQFLQIGSRLIARLTPHETVRNPLVDSLELRSPRPQLLRLHH
jgi:hypothetical protein